MTQQAEEWSEHDLEHRFSVAEPRDEFTRLAATLDGLLDRVAASLRHEQNLTAELSHELRTPLTQVSAEAQYALRHERGSAERQEAYERILAGTRHMERILDTLISAARAQAAPTHVHSDTATVARAAIDACAGLAREHGVHVTLRAPDGGLTAAVDGRILERVLAPLLENACRFARHEITVAIGRDGSMVIVEVLDDGPGIAQPELETVFTPGYRRVNGQDATGSVNGVGLGLPLARRLARGVGGEVRVEAGGTGARFVISVPRA
jgi:signal transduction histidine kinase